MSPRENSASRVLLGLSAIAVALSTPSFATEPIAVGMLQGWYVVEGKEPDGSLRARMFGEYYSDGTVTSGRNVMTYNCKKGWRDFLRINLAPEVKSMIATATQQMEFRFTDTITFVGKDSKSEWVAWFDAKSDSVVIEFPDNSEELIRRRFDLFPLLADDFKVLFGPLKHSPVPFKFLTTNETQTKIGEFEKFVNKKLEVQDRLQFLSYCTQLQF